MSIVIVDYDPHWQQMFEDEKARILSVAASYIVAVEHAGSTAVPGLGAKPIIDIFIGVENLEQANHCIGPLQALGYEYVPEFEDEMPDRRYFRKGNPRTYHIHIWVVTHPEWARHLDFRDYLRAHRDTARAYHQLKLELAAKFGYDRDAYTAAKTEFIQCVEELARKWKASRVEEG